ncbi:hypothetical protein L7F22_046302 [Adiantum nelumboides]|nr:hypothetical protein [Adiantum nelumboides]
MRVVRRKKRSNNGDLHNRVRKQSGASSVSTYGIGYQGTVLHVREDDTALAICGNAIASYSLKGGLNKPLIWGPRFGISVSVFDPSNNWIAFAEKGLHPSVFVYECGKQQLHTKIAGIAEVEVSALAFSKDGFRLLTVSCEPDFKLCLWDLQEREPSKLAEGSSEWLVEFASFNPDSSQQFCISGSGTYPCGPMRKTFIGQAFLAKIYLQGRMNHIVTRVEDDKSERSFQFIDGNLKTLLSENPSSSESSGGDGWQVLKVSQTMEKVSTICIGELHVVIAEAGGRVCWLSLPSAKSKGNTNEDKLDTNAGGANLEGCTTESDSTAEAETCTKAASTVVYSVNLDVLEVTNMMYNTDQTQLIVGAASGCIVVIKINKDLLVSTLSGQSGAAVTENFAAIQWRSAYHYGTIHGFATLGDGKFVLSSGHDGTVRVWEADRGKELSRHCFKSAQLCIDSHEETINLRPMVGDEYEVFKSGKGEDVDMSMGRIELVALKSNIDDSEFKRQSIWSICEQCSRCCKSKDWLSTGRRVSSSWRRFTSLGTLFRKDGVKMDPAKIKAIQDRPEPVNLYEVRSFLGLCSYYRRFIRFFAEIAASLHDLTRKGVVFRFGERQQQAFKLLKEKLTTEPVLILPDLRKSFQVQCDACGSSIGVVLMPDGHVIAYESMVLRGPEKHMQIYEEELLAVIHALESWKHYLLGADFVSMMSISTSRLTDHQSLRYFLTQAKLSEKHLSWAKFLSVFHFQLVHVAGKKNVVGDALSRRPHVAAMSSAFQHELDEMRDHYNTDEDFAEPDALVRGEHPNSYSLKDGFLMFRGKLCVSRLLPQKVMTESHSPPYAGHRGIDSTINALEMYFFWPSLRKDTESFVRSCLVCQRVKYDRGKAYGLLQPLPIPTAPWESIAMDFIFGIPKTSAGNEGIWTIVDWFSKQAHFIPVWKQITTEQMAKIFLVTVFKYHELPRSIVSDRDPRMRGLFWFSKWKLVHVQGRFYGAVCNCIPDKLHTSSIDKVSFDKNSNHVVAVCKADGRLYFLKCGSSDLDELELIGFSTLDDIILSIAWDLPTFQGKDDAYLLVSLSRGEIVKLKVPSFRAPNGNLCFDSKSLNCISFRTQVPLLSISIGKYYLEKEKVERKVVWGMGQDKKLQQYRIPENLQGWSGSSGNPLHTHFNMPGHAKPGAALVLHLKTSTLITGAEDGTLQIRDAVLDPLRQPQKVVDVQLYDGYLGGITAVVVAEERLFIGGANGVIFSAEAPAAGLKPASTAPGRNDAKIALLRKELESKIMNEEDDMETFLVGVKDINEQLASAGEVISDSSLVQTVLDALPDSYQTFASSLSTTFLVASNGSYKQDCIVDSGASFRVTPHKEWFSYYEGPPVQPEYPGKRVYPQAPVLEKLTPGELIVDMDLECELRSQGQERVSGVREQVIKDNYKKDIIAERIKHECWRDVTEAGLHN